ncbi:glycine zipper 2TM domain-containing protein [Novosphingobium album (ex Hu et al. 2023)]|uniref:17 kDa surface antigen n=1 Tax=Novosphingobium album (ex Hu et al. 2023) TaxID=2930093 RepID=A0ABT0B1V5_9SPHN|nr:glycine zipper 2TM domain-containing protein [Novosphingobium album (ex Hu et al. 2023)]MCJ2178863.1 glycine zipper 2TM domain-containing protein [Novosphingobium album (ex Hu et al. 2023)]
MRNAILAALMAALTLPAAMAVSAPAEAHDRHARQYHRTDNGIRYWRGDNGRYYCRKSDGTTGLLIGGVAGALVGRSIDTRGDRATGTILGAAAGALLGREVDRNNSRPHCR